MAVLGVFAKCPEPGRVKTRLGFAPESAAAIAAAFLRDTLERLTPTPARRIVVTAPPGADFTPYLAPGWEQEPQGAGDLGDRLRRFFELHLPAGAVVAVGTDSPTLPVEYVTQAFSHLAEPGVVLGPATDGGYYLIGVRGELPPLFANIDWSSPRVLEQTVSALPPGVRLTLLPPWYDVDTADDWQLLRGHRAALLRAGTTPPTALNLIVLRAADLARAAAFYAALGVHLVRERHGNGPEHLAADLGGTVFEVYPLGTGPTTSATRLGFRVPALTAALLAVEAVGGSIIESARDSPWGLRAVVADCDGHRVELVEASGAT